MPAQDAATPAAASSWTTPLTVAFLGWMLVGLHLVADERCYDVSQIPRLLALLGSLAILVPATWLVGRGRIDAAILRSGVPPAAAVFLGITALSLAATVNVTAGYTDLFRTLAAFLVLCLACLLLPRTPHWPARLLRTAVVAAVVAAGVGILETLSRFDGRLPSRRDMEAVTGLMSNVNLYAAFLFLLLPWCAVATALFTGRWRLAAGTATLMVTGMILLVQSRATWLGVAAAGLVATLTMLVRRRELGLPVAVRRGLVGALATGALAAVVGAGLTGTDTAVGRGLTRLLVTRPHQAAGPTDGGRTMIWGVTGRMVADHPLTGVGAGNFTVRLHEYYGTDDLDFTHLSSDNWVQPHNDFLWVAAEKGLPGLAAFGAVFAAAAWSLWRAIRAAPSPDDTWLAVATLAGLAGYVVLSCFDFPLDRVSHQVLLAVHLAVATLLGHATRSRPLRPLPLPAWLVLPPVLACLALGGSYATAAYRQEPEVIAARRSYRDGDWEGMRDSARRAATPWKTLDPLVTPIAYLEGKAELQLGHLPEAIARLEQAWEANPNRLYVLNDLGIAYAAADRCDDAIVCFTIAANRYPDRLEPRQNLANCFLDTDRFAEAAAVLENVPEALRTADMRTALAHARERLAAAAGE
jgi:O-antigen ligase